MCVWWLVWPWRQVPHPKKPSEDKTVWGLTRCDYCGVLWNRDVNAPQNILWLAQHARAGKDRPSYLTADYGSRRS